MDEREFMKMFHKEIKRRKNFLIALAIDNPSCTITIQNSQKGIIEPGKSN
jgi:hypothetical protein